MSSLSTSFTFLPRKLDDNQAQDTLTGKLQTIDIGEGRAKEYLNEAIDCFRNGYYRATILLLWNVLMYVLYKKIEEYGIENFVGLAKSKNMRFQGNINNLYDLNKLKDSDVLALCHDVGFFDQNVKNRLLIHLTTRNSFAHLTQAAINPYTVFEFVSDVYEYSKMIAGLRYKLEPTFMERLKAMDEDGLRRELSSMSFQRLETVVSSLLDKIALITDHDEYKANKNLYYFVAMSIECRDKESERVQLFDLIFRRVVVSADVPFPYSSELLDKIADYCRLSYIKQHIIDKSYIDSLITLFNNSWSYDSAARNSGILLGFKDHLTKEQVEIIANAAITNNQISDSWKAAANVQSILSMHREKLRKETIARLKTANINV
jgi:hypothetical protein